MRKWTVWFSVLASLLAGCASSSEQFEPTAAYHVTRTDYRTGQQFSLMNRSHPKVRSARGGMGPGIKVIEDARMTELLGFFSDWDFFEMAVAAAPNSQVLQENAIKAISVEMGPRTYTLVHELTPADPDLAEDRLEALQAIDTEFRYVFDSTHQLYFVDNPEGAKMFDEYKDSLGRER
ncbi:MAG: hypothetical protein RL885_07715 [Planctomycetota bacterium]